MDIFRLLVTLCLRAVGVLAMEGMEENGHLHDEAVGPQGDLQAEAGGPQAEAVDEVDRQSVDKVDEVDRAGLMAGSPVVLRRNNKPDPPPSLEPPLR